MSQELPFSKEELESFNKIPPTETEKEVFNIIRAQQIKGRTRYNVAISHKQTIYPEKWVDEIIEECADMIQYLVALKLCLINNKKGGDLEG